MLARIQRKCNSGALLVGNVQWCVASTENSMVLPQKTSYYCKKFTIGVYSLKFIMINIQGCSLQHSEIENFWKPSKASRVLFKMDFGK